MQVKLTRRQREVLRLVFEGRSNQNIAYHLHITVNTVQWHLFKIYNKLHASSRMDALCICGRLGLLDAITREGSSSR